MAGVRKRFATLAALLPLLAGLPLGATPITISFLANNLQNVVLPYPPTGSVAHSNYIDFNRTTINLDGGIFSISSGSGADLSCVSTGGATCSSGATYGLAVANNRINVGEWLVLTLLNPSAYTAKITGFRVTNFTGTETGAYYINSPNAGFNPIGGAGEVTFRASGGTTISIPSTAFTHFSLGVVSGNYVLAQIYIDLNANPPPPVPEPPVYSLISLGLLTLGVAARHRRQP